MQHKIEEFEFNGFTATVIIPENAHGKWVWKTEFLYAYDQAERALLDRGYTRVYYQISDKYGSDGAVALMKTFYDFVVEKYALAPKCSLFGFSRGGLYAFNFALQHPSCVENVYLDAPVLDMKTWPPKGSNEYDQLLAEYGFDDEQFLAYKGNPIDKLQPFFALKIPFMIVAGAVDEVVPFDKNAGILIDYCAREHIAIESVVKPDCGHHPHSLEDVAPIVAFVEGK